MSQTSEYHKRIGIVKRWLREAGWQPADSAFDYSDIRARAVRRWYNANPSRADQLIAKSARLLRGEAVQIKGGRPPKSREAIKMFPIKLLSARTEIEEFKPGMRDGIGRHFSQGIGVTIEILYLNNTERFSANALLVTAEQTPAWCKKQCQRLIDSIHPVPDGENCIISPGDVMRLAHSFDPLIALGIPTPPQQPYSMMDGKAAEWSERTGRPQVYYYNVQYQEWTRKYNEWQRENPELALDYGCHIQDENWLPVT